MQRRAHGEISRCGPACAFARPRAHRHARNTPVRHHRRGGPEDFWASWVAGSRPEFCHFAGAMGTSDFRDGQAAFVRPSQIPKPRQGVGWMRRWLGGPLLRYQVAAATIAVLLPSLWSGLTLDDFAQRLIVQERTSTGFGRLDLFRLISPQADVRARMKELGMYAWWLGAQTKIDYWRPVAAITHVVDYSLWPRWAWLMHFENLLWYAALVVACGAFYRRFVSVPWVAGLATVLYAFDHTHAGPVAWIANRNAIMSTLLGVLSVLAHDGWRRQERRAFAFAAPVLLALALFSAESGMAIAGYTLAYALCLDRGTRLQRVLSVLPSAFVIVAWRVTYTALGHGIAYSGTMADPFVNPGLFAAFAAQSIPTQIASALFALQSDIVMTEPWTLGVAALAAIALLGTASFALSPWLKRDETARFFAAGMVLSALPLGASIPIDRYLFWVGLGAMGLVAKLAEAIADRGREESIGKLAQWLCGAALFGHGVLSPLFFPFRAVGPPLLQHDADRFAATLPDTPDTARETVVVLNAPIEMMGAMLPILRIARHGVVPAHLYFLYAGTGDLTVSRVAGNALDVRSRAGWLHDIGDRGSRATPFRVGEVAELARMRAEVRELTPEGRPTDVLFSFPSDLEDPSLKFMVWGWHGLEGRAPPPVGETMTVGGVSLFKLFRPGAPAPRAAPKAFEPD